MPYSKAPRYKLKYKALKAVLTNNMLKLLLLKKINVTTHDFLWKIFAASDFYNKSTKVFSACVSYYRSELKTLLGDQCQNTMKLAYAHVLFTKVSLAALPLNSKAINTTMMLQINTVVSLNLSYFQHYALAQQYFQLYKIFGLYTNVNFYYFKIYEH